MYVENIPNEEKIRCWHFIDIIYLPKNLQHRKQQIKKILSSLKFKKKTHSKNPYTTCVHKNYVNNVNAADERESKKISAKSKKRKQRLKVVTLGDTDKNVDNNTTECPCQSVIISTKYKIVVIVVVISYSYFGITKSQNKTK